MTDQPDLFDAKAAAEARDDAIARASGALSEGARLKILAAVSRVCQSSDTFTTDDIVQQLGGTIPHHEPRVLGALMREAHRRGWCEPTDRTRQSTQVRNHRRPMRVWQSRISPSVRLATPSRLRCGGSGQQVVRENPITLSGECPVCGVRFDWGEQMGNRTPPHARRLA